MVQRTTPIIVLLFFLFFAFLIFAFLFSYYFNHVISPLDMLNTLGVIHDCLVL